MELRGCGIVSIDNLTLAFASPQAYARAYTDTYVREYTACAFQAPSPDNPAYIPAARWTGPLLTTVPAGQGTFTPDASGPANAHTENGASSDQSSADQSNSTGSISINGASENISREGAPAANEARANLENRSAVISPPAQPAAPPEWVTTAPSHGAITLGQALRARQGEQRAPATQAQSFCEPGSTPDDETVNTPQLDTSDDEIVSTIQLGMTEDVCTGGSSPPMVNPVAAASVLALADRTPMSADEVHRQLEVGMHLHMPDVQRERPGYAVAERN
jgi:hypothetical protein